MSVLAVQTLAVTLGGQPVLREVSLTLRPGEVTAVIGPNGAGKSTLLNCLAGLRQPDAGTVLLDDRPLHTLAPRERARRIGFLPQTPEIAWAVDAETLVGLGRLPYRGWFGGGLGAEDRALVSQAMQRTDTAVLAPRVVTTLSGGERGRVLLARALAGEPEWLLADEPLTGLDPGHQFDACDLLRGVAAEGRGVVTTLHDLSLAARLADRIVVLAQGRLVADGTPGETLTPALLAEVYGVNAAVTKDASGVTVSLLGRS